MAVLQVDNKKQKQKTVLPSHLLTEHHCCPGNKIIGFTVVENDTLPF